MRKGKFLEKCNETSCELSNQERLEPVFIFSGQTNAASPLSLFKQDCGSGRIYVLWDLHPPVQYLKYVGLKGCVCWRGGMCNTSETRQNWIFVIFVCLHLYGD